MSKWRSLVSTYFMPQHPLQPVLTCGGNVDGQCGTSIYHGHWSSGKQVLGEMNHNLRRHAIPAHITHKGAGRGRSLHREQQAQRSKTGFAFVYNYLDSPRNLTYCPSPLSLLVSTLWELLGWKRKWTAVLRTENFRLSLCVSLTESLVKMSFVKVQAPRVCRLPV